MSEVKGEPPRLVYRLVEPNSGSVIVPDLFHLHQSKWSVNAPIAGWPGSATMGGFTDIAFPTPGTREHKTHRDQVDAILNSANDGVGLKVEGWPGKVGAGNPVVSGVITKPDLPLDGPWRWSGMDTLLWLQQSQLLPGEQVTLGLSPAQLIVGLSGTQEVLWDDDFANWSGTSSPGHPASADYTVTGGAWSPTVDPQWGLSAITTGTNGARAISNSIWSDAQFAACSITAHGVITAGTDTTFAGEVGIYMAADSTGANGYVAELALAQTGVGSGLYNAVLRIYSVVASAFTPIAGPTTVFTNVPATFPFELTFIRCAAATGAGLATTTPTLRVLLNGQDQNVQVAISPGSGGRVGVRFGFAGGGTPAGYVDTLQFHSRTNQGSGWSGGTWGTNRFQVSFGGPTFSNPSSLAIGKGQTHLDAMVSALTFAGGQMRKDPGMGAKADLLNYISSTPGADLSGSVFFDEKDNVIANGTKVTTVAELYATDARVNAVPGSDSGGSVTWGRIGAPGDMVLTDTVSDVGLVGFSLMAQYARLIQARKVAPLQATQVTVRRDADLLRFNNGWGPRELDFVTVHLPTYNIRYQKAQIVGYAIDEMQGTVTYFLTQFPADVLARAAVQRVQRTLDYLTTTYAAR